MPVIEDNFQILSRDRQFNTMLRVATSGTDFWFDNVRFLLLPASSSSVL